MYHRLCVSLQTIDGRSRGRNRRYHGPLRGGRRWQSCFLDGIYTRLSIVDAIRDEIAAAPVPVVIDHFGGAQAALGVTQPGFGTLVDLVRTGSAYVKISGAYRASTHAPDYADATPLAKALIAANPRRIVWGTDWPHPDSTQTPGRTSADIAPLLQIDDGRLFNQLPLWAPAASQRRLILVENPARLYGFER
jgi:predicted TIM-barrel fold metal-dependent hydrolase